MDENEEYDSIADRQKAAQARVHTDLTDTSRERLAQLTANPMRIRLVDPFGNGGLPGKYITQSLNRTYEDIGYSGVKDYLEKTNARKEVEDAGIIFDKKPEDKIIDEIQTHRNLILNADTIPVLTYIENLLEIVGKTSSFSWKNIAHNASELNVKGSVQSTAEKINIALETEGILWELEYQDRKFNFKPIGSEMMQQADEEFSVVASGKKWQNVASPYDSAYNLYRDRNYSREIPEKLYNSVEELVRVICVDLEGWEENREQNLSVYLDRMRDEGIFEQNNIMRTELEDLTNSMERAFQKAGAERKNRHTEIDRQYSTLLLHQVSAYLTFIISRYEDKDAKDSIN